MRDDINKTSGSWCPNKQAWSPKSVIINKMIQYGCKIDSHEFASRVDKKYSTMKNLFDNCRQQNKKPMLLQNSQTKQNVLRLSFFLLLGLFLLPASLTYGNGENQKNYFVDQSLNSRQSLQTAVQQHTGENTYHLFSHGRPGQLLINGQWLNAKQISDWFTEEQLNNSTTQQLNIYGCNFAKGEKGSQAVAYLEKTLGISIAASNDITGKDGDWELEIGNTQNSLALNHYSYNLQVELCGEPLQAAYHATLVRSGENDWLISGEGLDGSGGNQLTFESINSLYSMPAGTLPVHVTVGGVGSIIVLLDNGDFYFAGSFSNWGIGAVLASNTLPSGSSWGKTTFGLPTGVTVSDVKKLTASNKMLMIITTSGAAYVLGQSPGELDPSYSTSAWNQIPAPAPGVTISDAEIAIGNLFMLGSDGNFYTMGQYTYKGDGTGGTSSTTPVLMNTPLLSGGLRQFDVGHYGQYHILDNSGTIHVLGGNRQGQLGVGNLDAQLSWTTATGVTDAVAISASSRGAKDSRAGHATGYIGSDSKVYLCGRNDENMLTNAAAEYQTTYIQASGDNDDALALVLGGHITPYINSSNEVVNTGHNRGGGFGDGTTTSRSQYEAQSVPVYLLYCLESKDFGDAPDTYGTTNGAQHELLDFNEVNSTSSLMLGSIVDSELEGQPSTAADGDGSDEDGITWPTLLLGNSYSETITLVNATGAGAYLNVWIDFDQDGTFEASERITSDQIVANAATTATLSFTVPPGATSGTTFARIRLCNGSGECNSSTGLADAGEVEDYQVTLSLGVEICNDGKDNDGDGYIDNFDPDCPNYAPILCDDKLYQSIRIGSTDYWLYEVETNPISMTPLFDLTAAGVGVHPGINSIAYNPVDGFIYGINMYPPYQLYRVNSAGEVQNLGNITGDITLTSGPQQQNQAGGMAADGTYYVTGSSEELYEINLTT
ncbi:MAG: DUF4347 domain-containing protein, partial [Gammaproteobacteria bacterium]|nr:DUF4347 domain-containing protein [Gammaproteobacteria bacterium]